MSPFSQGNDLKSTKESVQQITNI